MTEPLPHDELATFALFARELNFSRTARLLHLSQPAVFAQVKRLGEALGTPLYRRQGPRLTLTAAGQRVAVFAADLAARSEQLRAELAGTPATSPVTLCAGEGAYLYLLGEAIHRFSREHPALRLLTRDAQGTVEALLAGEAHLGVAVLDQTPAELESCVLSEFGQVLVMPRTHPLARRRRPLRLADLAHSRLVVPPAGRPLRALLDATLRAAGVPWEVGVEASGWPLLLHFVSLGAGLAVVNGCCTLPRGLVGLPLPALPPTRYLLLRRRGAPHEGPRARLWSLLRGG
jgi:DNA-binding transcriptional LysR family regulator